ncbi:MAG: prepilin peptidase [Proteobacteria bacterium]|nr:prepilin peptidase [Pseudomonadota bacterium]
MERGRGEITPSHITGLIAVAISLYFLIVQRDDLSIVAASVYFTLACTTDTFKSKIPNLLNVCLLVAGITLSVMALGMQGFLLSLSGLGLGVGLLLLPYLMGGIGAGDVKALGALGALIGPYDLLHVFVYMGLYGGGLALFHYLFQADIKNALHEGWLSARASVFTKRVQRLSPSNHGSHKGMLRFPYAAAIAFGYYSFVYWGGIL